MSRLPLTPRSGLEQLLVGKRLGVQEGHPGVTLALRSGCVLATVSVRKNQLEALARRVREVFGVQLIDGPKCVSAGALSLVWAGPGQWLAMGDGEDGAAFERRLRAGLGNLASVSDQSDGRTIIRVGGERVRDALAKGVPIDLHPRAFRAGDAAVTSFAGIGAHLWLVDETSTFEFIILRSFAAAFCEWLIDSAAQFGARIADEGS